jgi:hypothetical protein
MSAVQVATVVSTSTPASPHGAPAASRTLTVAATYWLSESGRKAALLAGLDGRARQVVAVNVPVNRLHLVTVDAAGTARLKLRPRYERDGEQKVLRLDSAPTYDVPPSIEDLFNHASRNYELERAYQAERSAVAAHRADSERELRARTAQAFLTDTSQRAVVHPAPTPARCFVNTEKGRRLFDVAADEGIAAELPPEAHRRFRADLRARAEKNRQERAAQMALHQAKKTAIAAWITEHGTPDQRARQDAAVLSLGEAIESLTDHVFAVVSDRPRYFHDGVARLEQYLRLLLPSDRSVTVAPSDLKVVTAEATTVNRSQWEVLEDLRAALPSATVRLRAHRLTWRRDPTIQGVTVYSVTVTQKEGLFTLRREYAAPD